MSDEGRRTWGVSAMPALARGLVMISMMALLMTASATAVVAPGSGLSPQKAPEAPRYTGPALFA